MRGLLLFLLFGCAAAQCNYLALIATLSRAQLDVNGNVNAATNQIGTSLTGNLAADTTGVNNWHNSQCLAAGAAVPNGWRCPITPKGPALQAAVGPRYFCYTPVCMNNQWRDELTGVAITVPCRLENRDLTATSDAGSAVPGGVWWTATTKPQDNDLSYVVSATKATSQPQTVVFSAVAPDGTYGHSLLRPCDQSYTQQMFVSDVKLYTDIDIQITQWSCGSINVRWRCFRTSSNIGTTSTANIADQDCNRLQALLSDGNTRISKITKAQSTASGSGNGGLWALFGLLLLPVCLIGLICCFKGRSQRDGVKEPVYPPAERVVATPVVPVVPVAPAVPVVPVVQQQVVQQVVQPVPVVQQQFVQYDYAPAQYAAYPPPGTPVQFV